MKLCSCTTRILNLSLEHKSNHNLLQPVLALSLEFSQVKSVVNEEDSYCKLKCLIKFNDFLSFLFFSKHLYEEVDTSVTHTHTQSINNVEKTLERIL